MTKSFETITDTDIEITLFVLKAIADNPRTVDGIYGECTDIIKQLVADLAERTKELDRAQIMCCHMAKERGVEGTLHQIAHEMFGFTRANELFPKEIYG
jgi:hypothetical protein